MAGIIFAILSRVPHGEKKVRSSVLRRAPQTSAHVGARKIMVESPRSNPPVSTRQIPLAHLFSRSSLSVYTK